VKNAFALKEKPGFAATLSEGNLGKFENLKVRASGTLLLVGAANLLTPYRPVI
jgi:hypothetical protein